jgi:hypothetical protein
LVNILILRLCNYDKSPDHVESAGKFTLSVVLCISDLCISVGVYENR